MTERDYTPVENSTMAVVSLIAGIAGWTIVPFFGSIVAVITGHMARREIRESKGVLGGEVLAKIGLILGYASLLVVLLALCVVIVAAVLFLIPLSQELGLLISPLFL